MLTSQRLPLVLFLLPCAALYLFSAVAAWRATMNKREDGTVGMPTHIGLHIGGVWVLPYALIALISLIGYPRLLPAYVAMLLPALAYVIWPGDIRRFGQALGVGVFVAAIATWVAVLQHLPKPLDSRLAITIETVVACTMAAMPVWTLAGYYRLVRRYRADSPLVVAAVVMAMVVLLAAGYGLLAIGMSGMTD